MYIVTCLKLIQIKQTRATNTNEQFASMSANGATVPALLFEIIEPSCLFVFVRPSSLSPEVV